MNENFRVGVCSNRWQKAHDSGSGKKNDLMMRKGSKLWHTVVVNVESPLRVEIAQSVCHVDDDLAIISIQDCVARSEAPNIQIIQQMSIWAKSKKHIWDKVNRNLWKICY